MEKNIISIRPKHLERYKIVLPGEINQNNAGGKVMFPAEAKILRLSRALNQLDTFSVTPSRSVLG